MIRDTFIARKYSIAFLNLYIDKIDDNTFLNIEKTLTYLLYNHDVLSFFSLPNISLADKINLIEIFLKKFQLPEEFKSLILLLIKHNRITLITDVLKYISYIYQDMTNSMKFEITSVCKLSESDINILENFLVKKTGKKIIPVFRINKNLIAGISIQSDLMMWEFSISQQLKKANKIAYKEVERLNGN